MGKLISGINGPFIGKVGTVIGSSRNGVPYLKGPHKPRKKDVSEKELRNRDKFAIAQAWLKPLLEVVRLGFKNYSERSQGFVAAKSYLYKHALQTEGDNIVIDPGLMKVSVGDLKMSDNAAVALTGAYELTFTWDPEPSNREHARDQVLLAAYNVGAGHVSYTLTGQFRSVGKDILPLAPNYKPGAVLHAYIAFIAADRSRQSDSLYLGEIVIP